MRRATPLAVPVLLAPALASVLALTLPPSRASGKEPVHVLRSGETVEDLAVHYYGARWKSAYILGRSKLRRSSDARPGTELAIPASWTYVVRRGDTLGRIAQRFLGSGERYEVLMHANGLRSQELEVGRQLLMPFHVSYSVQRGDSYSGIARRFYNTTSRATRIMRYNGGERELHPGDRLTIPIFDRTTTGVRDKLPPPAPRGAGGDPVAHEPVEASVPLDAADIDAALAAYSTGDFTEAAAALEDLLGERPPPAQRATLLRYLAFCAVAGGDHDEAADYFREWLRLEPKGILDPIQTSPKILEVFRAVVSEAEGRPEEG
jgi:nucleoid-associated protein YgaU